MILDKIPCRFSFGYVANDVAPDAAHLELRRVSAIEFNVVDIILEECSVPALKGYPGNILEINSQGIFTRSAQGVVKVSVRLPVAVSLLLVDNLELHPLIVGSSVSVIPSKGSADVAICLKETLSRYIPLTEDFHQRIVMLLTASREIATVEIFVSKPSM